MNKAVNKKDSDSKTTVYVTDEVKKELDQHKLIDQEPYYSVIKRGLESLDQRDDSND